MEAWTYQSVAIPTTSTGTTATIEIAQRRGGGIARKLADRLLSREGSETVRDSVGLDTAALDAVLNEHGAAGWELVGIVQLTAHDARTAEPDGSAAIATFKRRVDRS